MELIPANIKNIVFDLDGTLIDSSAGVIEATNYALKAIGEKERSGEEIKSFIGFPLEEMFHHFSGGEYGSFYRNFQLKAIETVAASAVPIVAADKVLQTLHGRGYCLGIGTTKIRIHVIKILSRLNWHHYVSAIVGADDVDDVKPAPEAFQKVLRRMNGAGGDAVVVGDTVNDIRAAHAAGIPAIGIRSVFGRYDDLKNSRPELLLDNLDGLLEIFI